MSIERSRLSLLGGAAGFAVGRALRLEAWAGVGRLSEVTVYKSPTCESCTERYPT